MACCAFLGEREQVNVAATVELCFAIVCSGIHDSFNTWSVDHFGLLSLT